MLSAALLAVIAAALILKLAFFSVITFAFAIRLPKIIAEKIASPIDNRKFKVYDTRAAKPLSFVDFRLLRHAFLIVCFLGFDCRVKLRESYN